MCEIKIRKATIEDAETIIDFNSKMAFETEEMKLNHKLISNGVKNLFSHPEYGYYLVAEKNGVIAGQLMITYEWSDWRNGLFWWVQSVYVAKEFRRQGIYKKMYEWIKEKAKHTDNVCGIRLYVEKENKVAQNTYKNLGMVETHYNLYEEVF